MPDPATPVHPTNTDQAAVWNGDQGSYWTTHAERFDQAVKRYERPFFDAAALEADSHVLDIGCGTGDTTRTAARRSPDGHALGVDISADMIARARELTAHEQLDNARFLCADAQVHRFDEHGFDVAISRTGAMFFGRPDEAFANIARALRPDGRLVLMTWQSLARNEWLTTLVSALTGQQPGSSPADQPGPFSLSEPEHVRGLLERNGFAAVGFNSVVEPMYYGCDVDDAFGFVIGLVGWMIRDLEPDAAAAATERLRSALEDRLTPEGVLLGSAAWMVTARRA